MNDHGLGYVAYNKQEAIYIFWVAAKDSSYYISLIPGSKIYSTFMAIPRESYYMETEYSILILPKKYPAYAHRWEEHHCSFKEHYSVWCIVWKYDDEIKEQAEKDEYTLNNPGN